AQGEGALRDDDTLDVLEPGEGLSGRSTGRQLPLADVRLLPPCQPTKLIIVARNYADHAKETGSEAPAEPHLHPIPASPVIPAGESIVLPDGIGRVDHEAELVVVIGRRCRAVAEADAMDYVAGLTCGNDVSARDIQWGKPPAFARGKSIDTFSPLGPWIVTDLDASDLEIKCTVSGEVRQAGRTKDMLFPIERLVSESSRWMTLCPGDCIYTGTPAGISPLREGDVCDVEIEGIGVLSNPVSAE
ncbi:MAG: 2-hydroxyhepta-2,4-diene-1,7-dioate isomerase, partial [Armatimonadia bacterium]|nr:2-hydroxyhepta-2,4-diene-1,7-dioate isomerase [Armatimonadia bacterium]